MGSARSGERLEVQNDAIKFSVLPEIGAKIFDFINQPAGQNLLWHNPRIEPQPYPIEANFDNYWCGGWDDGFPTCETCVHNGESYPNLGELRSVRWSVESYDPNSHVRLTAKGPISPVEAEKEVRLVGNALEMSLHIRHTGYAPLDFIWGTHPAYAVTPDCVLHIPAKRGLVGQASDPTLGSPGQTYHWPLLETPGGTRDMSRMIGPGTQNAGHYATELTAGWYAVEYPQLGTGLLFEFPLEVCPYLWLWLSYGGWRGYYLAVIEPWTSCPVTLSEAAAAGTHRMLKPGETFSCTVRATPWSRPTTFPALLAQKGLA